MDALKDTPDRSASSQPARSQIQQVTDLAGPAGRLEAILNPGSSSAPFTAVVCHPYPPAGGTMHTKVVYHTMKVLTALGIPVLRFNFRGVGLSEGSFDAGVGEQDDVNAAIDWLHKTIQRPVLFAGFSFGSYVGLRACCSDPRVVGRIALGLPVRAAGRDYTYDFLPACPGPLLFLSGSEDEFCPADVLRRIVATSTHPSSTILVAGADHFFQGNPTSPASKLPEMQLAIREWVSKELLPPSHQQDLV